MAIPPIFVKTVASSIPWKDVIAAAPDVWKSAKDLFASSKTKAEAPPVNPTDDVRAQVAALAARVHSGELADAEQAKLMAAIAGQMQAITAQMEAGAARARRLQWLAVAALAVSLAALAVVLARL